MRGACGDLISPAGVENIRGGKHHCCLWCGEHRRRKAPATCLADDAVRDPRGIFTDLAMPAVAAIAGPMCINTLLRTMYPGAASSILTACMMFPARFVPLQLLPSQYLLPDASCASDLHLCILAQGGSRTLSLLQLRNIALALSMWACVVLALLVCHGRTLTLGRRYVVLHAVW